MTNNFLKFHAIGDFNLGVYALITVYLVVGLHIVANNSHSLIPSKWSTNILTIVTMFYYSIGLIILLAFCIYLKTLFSRPVFCMSSETNTILQSAQQAYKVAQRSTGTTINNNFNTNLNLTDLFASGVTGFAAGRVAKTAGTPIGKIVTFGGISRVGVGLNLVQKQINSLNSVPTSSQRSTSMGPNPVANSPNEGSFVTQIVDYIKSDYLSHIPGNGIFASEGYYNLLFMKYNLTMVNLHYTCIISVIAFSIIVLFYFSPIYGNFVGNTPVVSWVVEKMVGSRKLIIILMMSALLLCITTIHSGINYLYENPIPTNLGSLVDKVIVEIVNNGK